MHWYAGDAYGRSRETTNSHSDAGSAGAYPVHAPTQPATQQDRPGEDSSCPPNAATSRSWNVEPTKSDDAVQPEIAQVVISTCCNTATSISY